MRVLNNVQVLRELAKALHRPCIFINFYWRRHPTDEHVDWTELLMAAPYLHPDKDGQAIMDGAAIIVCEDEDEMWRVYRRTVGDDGPTETNPYNGPARVYALTCGADGELQTENT